jgi:hypothetical protein
MTRDTKITISVVVVAVIILVAQLFFLWVYPAAAQQLQEQTVTIPSHSMRVASHGSAYVVGEVKNGLPNEDDVIRFVQIVGRFYDADGSLIATDYTYTANDHVRPGEKTPFRLILTDESVIDRIENYTLSVSWDSIPGVSPERVRELTVLTVEEGDQHMTDFGAYEVVGEVVNGGTELTQFAKVIATAYDGNGNVIDTEYTYTQPSDIAAGQSGAFEITFDDEISDDIESVKLVAESSEYFGVNPDLEQRSQQQQQQEQEGESA